MKKIRVLVVDDSALIRRVIGDMIELEPGLELAGTARDGLDALKKIKADRPDVVTLDLEMPRLNGIQTLRRIMQEDPLPVIMLSGHTLAGSEATLKALDAGAVDFIAKPSGMSSRESMVELQSALSDKIAAASMARLAVIDARREVSVGSPTETAIINTRVKPRVIVAVGASTGGPKVLEAVFRDLPADLPATVLLSQHMPPGFTASFAQRLDNISALSVKEAADGDSLLVGRALVAPGGYHLVVKKDQARLDEGPKVNYVKPSIDVMLQSLVECEQKVIVVVMTGMGKDGGTGAAELKKFKGDTICLAQDPQGALIPSMPDALFKSVSGTVKVPVGKMAAEISDAVRAFI